MVEPVVGAAIAKALGNSSPEKERATTNLLIRILGPSADAIGEALARYTTYRLRNVGRIINRASAKSRNDDGHREANPRVAHVILEDGSYCDNEIMADYLGGVLAASRTPNGRDDRAVTWSKLVTSLSSLQIRAHYLLYREWAERLLGLQEVNLGVEAGRDQAVMHIELTEFVNRLIIDNDVPPTVLSHAIVGLERVGLLESRFTFGPKNVENGPNSAFANVITVRPSVMGLELYGWAQGLPGMTPQEFIMFAEPFDAEEVIPRIKNVEFPLLPPSPVTNTPSLSLSTRT